MQDFRKSDIRNTKNVINKEEMESYGLQESRRRYRGRLQVSRIDEETHCKEQ